MKRLKTLTRHLFVPHRGNAFRPHAFRNKSLSIYLGVLVIMQLALGITAYSGPEVKGADTERTKQEIIKISNIERGERGLNPLAENEYLNTAAEAKLNDMFLKNYWDHTGPGGETAWDFMEKKGYQYEVAGENLARGFSDPEEVVVAWMRSPSHRENILNNRFQEIGIAIGTGEIRGARTTVIVQLFGRPLTAFAAARAETPEFQASPVFIPEASLENATMPSRAPYLVVWGLIFGLIIIDGLMLRKLGLHSSRKHLSGFRLSIFLSIVMLALLSIGVAAIA